MNKSAQRLVFCDFDGTIAKTDVGYHLLSHFSNVGNDDLVELWNSRQIGARECLQLEVSRVTATREEMLAYVDTFEIDPGFAEFVERLYRQGSEPVVLSDGLDFYIRHLLDKHGFADLEVHSNSAVFGGETLRVEFPYNDGCGRCGACKAERIRQIVSRENFSGEVVFIGDGYSDICAISETDTLYAKKDLRKYCLETDTPFESFETFADITRQLFSTE